MDRRTVLMKVVHHKGHKLEMYDSIQDIRADRFHEYNRFLLLDSGIGSDVEAVDSKLSKINQYLSKGDVDSAKLEAHSLQQALRFIITNTSPEMSAFVALIHRLNGKVITDLSVENVQGVIKQLGRNRWSIGKIRSLFSEVKKNLTLNSKSFFRS